MIRDMRRSKKYLLLAVLLGATQADAATAQALPDSILQRIRAGAVRVVISGDSVALPLIGTRTLPLVEVFINQRGPYRFLIDLGSNVTLVRRNVVDESRAIVLVERTSSDIIQIDAIELGQARLEHVTAGAYDELDVDGVLGYNVLQYSSFTLDLPGQRLVLHRRALPPPDNTSIVAYQLHGRMPYVMLSVGSDSLLVNLDSGAAEWMTIPSVMQSRFRWTAPPMPGRTVFNNQTGRTRILEGTLVDTVRLGALEIPSPKVYINPDAEDAWIGAAAMSGAVWTFDPRQRRVEIIPAGRR